MTEDGNGNLGNVKFYPKMSIGLPSARSPAHALTNSESFSSASIDPDVARVLFEEGAFLIFLDVPERTEFGIDFLSWNVGEKFKGLKLIPPGVHFVHYSAVSKENLTSPRTGFFHNFVSKEVMVKQWDRKNEGVCIEPVSVDLVESLRSNLKNMDVFLGAYPYEIYKKWVSMSRWISGKTIQRLAPSGPHGSIFSVRQLESSSWCSRRTSSASDASSGKRARAWEPGKDLPEMKVLDHTRIRFSDLGLRSRVRGAAPDDITKLSMDKSATVENVLREQLEGDDKELLGEIQFAFVCFLVGQVYDSFEQWKKLVALFCGCERAMLDRPKLFLDFIGILYYQLQEIPRDFFVDIVSRENFLTSTLQVFFATTEGQEGIDGELRRKALQFRHFLQKFFKWDFTFEPADDAPTVVEL